MAIGRETLKLIDSMRVQLDAHVDDVTRTLVASWVRAWDVLAIAWGQAISDALAQVEEGRWPDAATIARLERATKALDATRISMRDLSDFAGVTVTQALPAVTAQAIDWQRRLVDSQLPAAHGLTSSVSIEFNRVDPQAIDAIVRRTATSVTSYLQPLSAAAEEQTKRALVQGVALGDNPRTAASRMLANVEGEFNGGLARALNVARTEMLDAHRHASLAADVANPKLVTGWTWWATLDERTCPSCWSMHGQQFPPDAFGPDDHQSGRCARMPTTASWRDLGIDLDEPSALVPDAEATFGALPENKQLAIMGPTRLQLLRDGDVKWTDLSVQRSSADWRDSRAVRPVRDLARAS